MKFIIISLTVLLASFSSFAQDFAVDNFKNSISTAHQKVVSAPFSLKNFSNSDKTFQISLNKDFLKSGSNAKICVDGECDDNDLKVVVPALSSSDIVLQFEGGLSNFRSTLLIEIKDLAQHHLITKEISVEVTNQKNEDIFFNKDNILVSNFYPNPATEFASMQYSIGPFENNAKIILQNVLGSVVDEYPLDPMENKLRLPTENMSPGVYFYTLFIQDEGLATRKLIVKK